MTSENSSSTSSLYAGSASISTASNQITTLPSYLSSTIHEALDSEKLDRCIALQAQTSGMLNSECQILSDLHTTARETLALLKNDFAEGIRLAQTMKKDLVDLQKRIRDCETKAKRKIPVEWHTCRDSLNDADEEDD